MTMTMSQQPEYVCLYDLLLVRLIVCYLIVGLIAIVPCSLILVHSAQ